MAAEESIPETAPAVVHNPSTKTLSLQSLPVPTASNPDEHLIRVHAVALTNGELEWPEPAEQAHPVPGYEVAGTVVRAPAGSAFAAGTEVYARTSFDRQGSARIYTVALAAELGRKPRSLGWEEAATVPLSALTAWQALFVHGGLVPPGRSAGDGAAAAETANGSRRLLVTAAAGGVGLWVVQLARLAGVGCVVGTCGTRNVDFVKQLGADVVLDYTKDELRFFTDTDKFDLVVDCVGGDTLAAAWTCAKEGAMVISVALPAHLKKPASGVAKDVRSLWFIVEASGHQLGLITELIEAGKVKTAFDSAFALDDYEKAFEKVHSGHVRGKVVLKL